MYLVHTDMHLVHTDMYVYSTYNATLRAIGGVNSTKVKIKECKSYTLNLVNVHTSHTYSTV